MLKNVVLISLFCFCCFNLKSQDFDRNQFVSSSLGINYQYNQFNDSDLLLDKLKSTCPEMYFGRDVMSKIDNICLIDINENTFGENEMGYFHIKNERGRGEL